MFESCGGCCVALVVIPLLCCALVVCGLIYVASTAPDPPLSDNFKANPAEAAAFDGQINLARNNAASGLGGFTLTFTERQISSWLALQGETFADEHDISFPFDNVQMGLEDGEMTFYGEVGTGRAKIPLEVVIKPEVDRANHLDLNVESVKFLGLKLPGALVDSVINQLEEKVIQPIEDVGTDYVLDPFSLSIRDGVFSVNGQILR
jgi:hypothetical protein